MDLNPPFYSFHVLIRLAIVLSGQVQIDYNLDQDLKKTIRTQEKIKNPEEFTK